MAFLDLQDVRIHYKFEPQPHRDVLVFCNSLGSDLSIWAAQRESLRDHFSLLRYDNRGHGASSVPPNPYSIDQISRDLLGLLDGLGLERVHFCGLSLGGMVGQWLGAHAPDRLKRLVLANTAARLGSETSWNERIAAVQRDGMAAIFPGILERWFTAEYRRDFPEVIAEIRAMVLSMDPAGYVASCAALRDMDQREAVKRIQVPTLVVFGTHDPVTTPQDAQYLLQSIAGSQSLSLPAAHLSNVEAASGFSAGLRDFLLGSTI